MFQQQHHDFIHLHCATYITKTYIPKILDHHGLNDPADDQQKLVQSILLRLSDQPYECLLETVICSTDAQYMQGGD